MALTTIKTTSLPDDAITAAKIADESVDEARVQISNAGTNGQYLQKQSGNTGGLTWADVPAGVGGATGVDFNDTVKIRSGTDNDLEIFHSGSHGFIDNSTGELQLRGAYIRIRDKDAGESMATFDDDGPVELYYDNVKKFETMNAGVTVAGYVSATGDNGYAYICNDSLKSSWGTGLDLNIFHDGSDSYIHDSGTGSLKLRSNAFKVMNAANNEAMIYANENGAVELYYDNSKKLETTSGGVKVSGALQLNDGHKIHFGTDEDLEIVHDGTNGEIKNKTGYLGIYPKTGEMGVKILPDANVELYFDNSKKLETTNTGISVTGSVTPSSGVYIGGSGGGNHLADYEHGSFTVTNSGAVNWKAGADILNYVKVGKLVCINGQIQCSNGTGDAQVTNLPFSVADNGEESGYACGAVRLHDWDLNSDTLYAVAQASGSTLQFRQCRDDGSAQTLAGDNSAYAMISVSYQTND